MACEDGDPGPLKKLLFTGAGSFIARELIERFRRDNYGQLYTPTHKDLDILNKKKFAAYCEAGGPFDVVFHCASVGGKRDDRVSDETVSKNVRLFKSVLNQQEHFGHIVVFGSGAEASRSAGVNSFSEDDFFKAAPDKEDYYGISKWLITRAARDVEKCLILRLFGVMGYHEPESRFFRSNIERLMAGEKVIVDAPRRISYIAAEDLYRVVRRVIELDFNCPKEMNVVYRTDKNVVDINERLEMLAEKMVACFPYEGSRQDRIEVRSKASQPKYTGISEYLDGLDVEYSGMESEIIRLAQVVKTSKLMLESKTT